MAKGEVKMMDHRALMELAVEVMNKSKNEPRADGKVPPKVGAVLAFPDGEIVTAYRGELRDGDHAEFTLIERKLSHLNLEECVLFTTLEPCVERNHPKVPCCRRTTNARIKMVYVGITDPDPTVDGKGMQHLVDSGANVKMFDRDLQDIILHENEVFISQAVDRKKKAEEADLLGPLERMIKDADINLLSEKALEKFKKESNLELEGMSSTDFYAFLSDLRLMEFDTVEKVFRPTGLGILMFGKNPRARYPQAALMASVKYGENKVEPRTFDEALVLLPDAISDWLKKVLPLSKEIVGFKREDILEIPLEVLREAVINAIVHRDYMIEVAKSSIEIDDLKITVKSPGMPLPYITLEQLNSYEAPSISRNPVISYIFGLMNYAEEKGFGMRAFRDLHEKKGFPTPKFSVHPPFLVLTFPRDRKAIMKVAQDYNTADLSEEELKELAFVRMKKDFTRREFEQYFSYVPKKAERQIGKLEKRGLVERKGGGRSTSYSFVGE